MKRILTLFVVLTVVLGFWQSSLGAGRKAEVVEGGQTEKELLAYPEGTVLDVYISSDNPKIIIGKLIDGTTAEILSVYSLPTRKNVVGEEMPFPPGGFSFALVSPDARKVFFSVSQSGALDPGFNGIVDLETEKITKISVRGSATGRWSPNSHNLALICGIGMSGLFTIYTYDVKKSELSPPLLQKEFYKKWDVNKISDLRWSEDGSKIFFKAKKTKFDFETKQMEVLYESSWSFRPDGAELEKLK